MNILSRTCRANGITLAGIGRLNRASPRGRFQVVRRRILRCTLLQLDRGRPRVHDVRGVVMLPGMWNMGVHRVTLENGGVVQGSCLNGGSGGGGSEQEGESTKSNGGLHSN